MASNTPIDRDYARDQHARVTYQQRVERERAIAAFDGTAKPINPRDSDWIARELGDVPYREGLVCMGPLMPAVWFPVESLGRDQ